jgi:predicted RNase H-like nuclease (RuvC/YqgF family)
MQQDDEDRKNEFVIEGLGKRINELETSLKEKDSLLHSGGGSLVEVQSQNEKLSKELEEARKLLERNSDRFNHESETLNARIKAEVQKNHKLKKTIKTLRNKCFSFATQCIARLKGIFSSVGAASEVVNLSVEDILGALGCVEKEVDVLDEVITSHGDLCALVASRGTAAAFIKDGCNHIRAVNRPNFSLSPSDLVDILVEARSIGNRFITQIWAKGGQEMVGDEAQNLLNKV